MATVISATWNPTAREEAAFQATDETFQWLCALPVEVVREYAGKWVAARDKRIIAFADSLDSLLTEIKGVDLQSLIIDRVDRSGWTVYR